MYVWLNLKTIKIYLIKLATYLYWQLSYLLCERALLQVWQGSMGVEHDTTPKILA